MGAGRSGAAPELADEARRAFVEAVEAGDVSRVRSLCLEHSGLVAEIDAPRFQEGLPAVVVAARRGDREMLDLLLGLGAAINARSEFWGRTVGVFDESPPELHDFLVERGGLPELSEFVVAVSAGRVAEVRRLLDGSSSLVEKIDEPLFPFASPALLVARENLEMVDLLLEHGADIDVRSDWDAGGFGVLHGASPGAAKQLIARGARLDVHAAAGLGMMEELRQMLAADPGLARSVGGDGQTPLHTAATPEIIDLLLEHGAELDVRDVDHDSTPAQYQVDRAENCRRLIECGAEVDLFMAAALGDLDLVKAELARSPESIHARLHQQPYDRGRECCPNIYNWKLGFRLSPHQVAKAKGHDDVYAHLMEVSDGNERFLNACLCGEEELVRAMLEQQADLVATLADRDRCRFADAVWCGNVVGARLMLEAGFDVDERDEDGTALCGALLFGNLEMVELLLPHGPDLSVRNAWDSTPLGVCSWASANFHDAEGDYPECARRLLAAGSEVESWMLKIATPEVRKVLAG